MFAKHALRNSSHVTADFPFPHTFPHISDPCGLEDVWPRLYLSIGTQDIDSDLCSLQIRSPKQSDDLTMLVALLASSHYVMTRTLYSRHNEALAEICNASLILPRFCKD